MDIHRIGLVPKMNRALQVIPELTRYAVENVYSYNYLANASLASRVSSSISIGSRTTSSGAKSNRNCI